MRHLGSILILVLICLGQNFAQSKPKTIEIQPATPEEKREAEKAWELLIKAKGGREKLHSIRNMLSESQDGRRMWTFLYVFPNLLWGYSHARDPRTKELRRGVFRLDVRKNETYNFDEHGLTEIKNEPTFRRVTTRVALLMETGWDKPVPKKLSSVKVGRKRYDLVETQIYGMRLDFAFDPEDFLVYKVYFYDNQDRLEYTSEFSDYSLFNGVMMPRTVNSAIKDGVPKTRPGGYRYAFNVDYDPGIFTRQLKATNANAWRLNPN